MMKFLVGCACGAGLLFYFTHRPVEQEAQAKDKVSTFVAKRAPMIKTLVP